MSACAAKAAPARVADRGGRRLCALSVEVDHRHRRAFEARRVEITRPIPWAAPVTSAMRPSCLIAGLPGAFVRSLRQSVRPPPMPSRHGGIRHTHSRAPQGLLGSVRATEGSAMKNIVVTGGSGKAGRAVCRASCRTRLQGAERRRGRLARSGLPAPARWT